MGVSSPHSFSSAHTAHSRAQIADIVYHTIFRRNSPSKFHTARITYSLLHRAGVFVPTVFAGAFAFGVGFDIGVTSFWDRWNKGVRAALLSRTHLAHPPRRSNGRTFATATYRRMVTTNKSVAAPGARCNR